MEYNNTVVTVLKEFDGKYGKIKLEKYEWEGHVEYHVTHSYEPLCHHEWFKEEDKYYAIRDYQFMCAKY